MKCPYCNGKGSVGPDVRWNAHDCATIYRTNAMWTAEHGDYVYAVVRDGEPDEDDIEWYVMRAFADDLGWRHEWLRKDRAKARMLASHLASKGDAMLVAHRDMEAPRGATREQRDDVRKLEAELAQAKRRLEL